jgi:hypothetical protein
LKKEEVKNIKKGNGERKKRTVKKTTKARRDNIEQKRLKEEAK